MDSNRDSRLQTPHGKDGPRTLAGERKGDVNEASVRQRPPRGPWAAGQRLCEDYGKLPVMLARGPYCDFDILAEGGQKIHQTLDGKDSGLAAHQPGDVRLRDAEQYPRPGLGEIALRPGYGAPSCASSKWKTPTAPAW